ncbi:MAG: response regulator [Leptospiraceae bacterium]|nr:response regulator [Leptospiraceae bacterium]MDW8305637.1 response regulator [Leptospiraceae bacterium]
MDRKGYILCVDDEAAVVEALKEQLLTYFAQTHEVVTALSAEEALEFIHAAISEGEIIELIITDQVMPGMKGDEFLTQVHKLLPDTMKILLTGQAGLDSAIRAINYGGLNRYYEKPWNMEVMAKDLAGLIQKFRENLENQYLLNNLKKRIEELERELRG